MSLKTENLRRNYILLETLVECGGGEEVRRLRG